MNHIDSITIGRNPVLTYRIVTGIAAREAKTCLLYTSDAADE